MRPVSTAQPSRRPHHTRRGRRTRRATAGLALAAAGALALTACGGGGSGSSDGADAAGGGKPHLSVHGAYVPEPVTADMAGGFLTVRNTGDAPDKLTSVTSGLSDDVQIHRTKHQQMERVKSLPVPANGELRLGRGGNHLMLLKLERKPAEGEKVSLTLHFAKSGPVTVSAPVKATNYVPKTHK